MSLKEKQLLCATEKRLLTYNPKLAAKKRYEINRLVEKARSPAMSHCVAIFHAPKGVFR